ncbi:hypothetical protein KSP40_PGU015266 [Platanthera guangdongensis]|uniref:GTD-binding domain-containing protein n=1 Tax=Platanthera guangdongensis TaxID=2320717 RepID=A0ABR2MG71_9ASPA
MTEAEVITLKEALINQAQFIRELSDELDEERKAAASGADEALSMIFRLQEGRALQKMEAVQFKRIAEAKMLHTEELLAFLKESILEKDGEISTLKLQLQSYRQNMQRYGICDTDVEEIDVVFDSEEPKPDMRVDNLCAMDDMGIHSVCLPSNSESLLESNSGYVGIDSKCSSSCLTGEAAHSMSIHDIYEVPKNSHDNSDSCHASMEANIKTCAGSLVNDLSYMTPRYSNLEKGVSMNSLQSDFEQLRIRLEKIENDQKIMKEEDSKRNDEQLNLLRGVHDQLKAMQAQTKVQKNKRVSKQDEILLASISENVRLYVHIFVYHVAFSLGF